MTPKLILPKDKKELTAALERLRATSTAMRNAARVNWFTSYEYLRGTRNFEELNYRDGIVRASKNDGTTLDFRLEMVSRKVTDEIGNMLRMDTSPKTTRRKMSLDAQRRRSVAQLALDSVLTKQSIDKTKMDLCLLLGTYGCAAMVVWMEPMLPKMEPSDKMAPTPEVEVFPPWELLCIPADPTSLDQVSGLIRSRWVPLEWLTKLGFKELEANRKKLIIKSRAYGQPPASSGATSILNIGEDQLPPSASDNYLAPTMEEYVCVNELWLPGSRGTLARYIIWVNEVILGNHDFTANSDPPMYPVAVARYSPCGGFYSRSLPEMLIPINQRNETALDSIYRNVEELRVNGSTWIPASSGVSPTIYDGSDIPKFVPYEPDYGASNSGPIQLHPASMGNFPAEACKLGLDLMNLVSPPSPMQDKGRVDSAAGLGFLQEMSTVPMTYCAMSVAQAYSTVYSALLDKLRRTSTGRRISVRTFLDDSLAGVTIDPESGTLESSNSIPSADEVEIGIASATPVSVEQQKADLQNMLKIGAIDLRWFRILARKEDLGLPVGNDAEWENYRMAMMNNIILFGDGKTPGEGAELPPNAIWDLQLQVMDAFISRPEFALASPPVKERFYKARENIQANLGGFPQQLPYSEDAASMMGGGQGQMGMPGQMPQGPPQQ